MDSIALLFDPVAHDCRLHDEGRYRVFAELERAMIRERTRSALGVKRSRGERISRHAPFGWDFGPTGNLVENPGEQERLHSGLVTPASSTGASARC